MSEKYYLQLHYVAYDSSVSDICKDREYIDKPLLNELEQNLMKILIRSCKYGNKYTITDQNESDPLDMNYERSDDLARLKYIIMLRKLQKLRQVYPYFECPVYIDNENSIYTSNPNRDKLKERIFNELYINNQLSTNLIFLQFLITQIVENFDFMGSFTLMEPDIPMILGYYIGDKYIYIKSKYIVIITDIVVFRFTEIYVEDDPESRHNLVISQSYVNKIKCFLNNISGILYMLGFNSGDDNYVYCAYLLRSIMYRSEEVNLSNLYDRLIDYMARDDQGKIGLETYILTSNIGRDLGNITDNDVDKYINNVLYTFLQYITQEYNIPFDINGDIFGLQPKLANIFSPNN